MINKGKNQAREQENKKERIEIQTKDQIQKSKMHNKEA
jgi:hypothetical protein